MASNPPDLRRWRIALVTLGLLLIVAAVALEIDILNSTTTKTETVSHGVKTTVTGAPAPANGLVTGALGLGVACLLVASFLDRIKKISVGGVEIELDPASIARIATLAAIRVNGESAKIEPLVMRAIGALKSGTVAPLRQEVDTSLTDVADSTFMRAVETAAAELGY
jgi:hypothetical protein